jgi:c-di-GMP-binding flagellar brake protein YcgR
MEAGEKNTKPPIEVIESENRRYPRFDIHLPIEYYQTKSSISYTGNLSEGGLLIYSPEKTDVSHHVRLKLYFSLGSEVNTIKVLTEVVWSDTPLSKDREYFQYGVKFVDISPKDETKLRNFLRSLSSPLDDMVGLFNTLRMRLWTWKLMNLA